MQIPLQIDFHTVRPTDFAVRRISRRVARLERLCGRILACRVAIDLADHRHRHGSLYRIHVTLRLPWTHLDISRNADADRTHADLAVAIRDAFDTVERLLIAAMQNRFRRVARTEAHRRLPMRSDPTGLVAERRAML